MKEKLNFIYDFLFIILGTAIFALSLLLFNIPNQLAEGGITGITLIIKALFNVNPALSNLLLNIPLLLLGGKVLGTRSFTYTVLGTVSLSFFLWFWQLFPININIDHDILIAALAGGFFSGLGSGLVYRVGGTTGGTDVVARILENKFGISMGRSLLIFDCIVLTASLVYIDVKHMVYTLIASYVFSTIVSRMLDGSYLAKGILIVTEYPEIIGKAIMDDMARGVTYFRGVGGYSEKEKKIIYCVISPGEVMSVKRIAEAIDPKAFISVVNVHEALGEGFSFGEKPPRSLKKLKTTSIIHDKE